MKNVAAADPGFHIAQYQTQKGGPQTYFLNFYRQLHEKEKKLTERMTPLDPPQHYLFFSKPHQVPFLEYVLKTIWILCAFYSKW